jgi:hypothetical protein
MVHLFIFSIRFCVQKEKIMSHKLFRILSVCAILALVFALAGGGKVTLAMPVCNPAFVTIDSAGAIVSPTGLNDTANLQCAFDAAVSAGPGMTVRLVEGTYHTAQIVVNDFYGQFLGAGANRTLILNLSDVYVTPVDFFLIPPSAANPAPFLFTFLNGDYSISDLAINIIGTHPTQSWTIYGIDPPLHELAAAVACLGNEAHVRVDHVLVKGEHLPGSLFGFNLFQAIYFEGFIGDPSPAITGSFQVQFSTFSAMASGTPLYNVANAAIVISHNHFEDSTWGMDVNGIQNSSVEFSHNDITSNIGIDIYNMDERGVNGNTFLIVNNQFRGENGVYLQYTGEGNRCLVKGNNVQHVTGIGIYLGPGVNGCMVVGRSTKTSVLDSDTNNILVGVNNMGAGIGPMISSMMRMRK